MTALFIYFGASEFEAWFHLLQTTTHELMARSGCAGTNAAAAGKSISQATRD
jgi:hypothetical protein